MVRHNESRGKVLGKQGERGTTILLLGTAELSTKGWAAMKAGGRAGFRGRRAWEGRVVDSPCELILVVHLREKKAGEGDAL